MVGKTVISIVLIGIILKSGKLRSGKVRSGKRHGANLVECLNPFTTSMHEGIL
jgi:hypothetical protein